MHDVAVSRDFYADVLGGEVVLEENPAIVKVANSWSIMNRAAGHPGQARRHPCATRARGPGVGVHQRAGGRHRSFHREATAKGAQFLTEPLDRKAELRCYLRDPDGFLVEVGQATGMLEGVFADPPAGNQR